MEEPQVNAGKAIFVSNLSPKATEKTVSDFFSFCGRISRLYMKREPETSSAVVEFESESAAKTALLLTNALIIDRPISVTPYTSNKPAEASTNPTSTGQPDVVSPTNQVNNEQITQRDFGNVKDDERTKTSVVASLFAAGYILGKDVATKANDLDNKHLHIGSGVNSAVQQMKAAATQVDTKLKITQTATNVSKKLNEQTHKIDDSLKLSERMRTASQSAKEKATQLNQKVKENETIQKGVTVFSGFFSNIKNEVTTTFKDLSNQTKQAIAEKEQNRQQQKQHHHNNGDQSQQQTQQQQPSQPGDQAAQVNPQQTQDKQQQQQQEQQQQQQQLYPSLNQETQQQPQQSQQ